MQATWLQLLVDPNQLYRNFYNLMQKVSYNITCACCGIIGHNIDDFIMVLTGDESLAPLAVNPDVVPFSFNCGITAIDQHHIMIDPLAIMDENTVSICNKCWACLLGGSLPDEALANYRWIGPVPDELQDLIWVEEALVAHSHMFGRIYRLEQRRNAEPTYSSLKGHIIESIQ